VERVGAVSLDGAGQVLATFTVVTAAEPAECALRAARYECRLASVSDGVFDVKLNKGFRVTAEEAEEFYCPRCGVAPGERCLGSDRIYNRGSHAERHVAAIEAGVPAKYYKGMRVVYLD
jgi:hypothetical protein